MNRFFVVGNGPSLTAEQLDMIEGFQSVGLNRINLIYPETNWRPTYYVKTDHNPRLVDIYNDENILNVSECKKKAYLWEMFKDGMPYVAHKYLPVGMGEHPKVTWVKRCEHHYIFADNYMKRAKSWHLPEICTAFSGIGPAIQVAVLNGADEIYLIGCDIGYGNAVGQDHFSLEYSLNKKKLGEWDSVNVNWCHVVAKRSSPVPIYNATIGGELEVYPRVDIMDIL